MSAAANNEGSGEEKWLKVWREIEDQSKQKEAEEISKAQKM